mgnify:CR=1 FL=1
MVSAAVDSQVVVPSSGAAIRITEHAMLQYDVNAPVL